MKICIELDKFQVDILDKICPDNNYSKFLHDFLQKHLFLSLTQSNSIVVHSHVTYYEEVEKIVKLVGIKQNDIAKKMRLSQAAIAKAFKLKNDNSVIFRNMQQHGSPDNFLFDMYVETLLENEDAQLFALNYAGVIYNFFNDFLYDSQKREACFRFIMLLNSFTKRIKPKHYNPELFYKAVIKLDQQLFLSFDNLLVSDTKDIEGNKMFCYRSAKRLFTALHEYYLSLPL